MKKGVNKKILAFLKHASDIGVEFDIHVGGGMTNISAEEVFEYIRNPVEFCAKWHGMDVETYQQACEDGDWNY